MPSNYGELCAERERDQKQKEKLVEMRSALKAAAKGLRNLVEFGAILPNFHDEAIRQAEKFESIIATVYDDGELKRAALPETSDSKRAVERPKHE
jgi:hypothetical protein